MTRYARRTDRTHVEIKRVFERVGRVWDCAGYGGGMTDLIVSCFGIFAFVEVKDGEKAPSKRKLRKTQEEFKTFCDEGGAPYYVVTSVDEAEALIEAMRLTAEEALDVHISVESIH